jgi:predicted membrane chloride channel (bestrophin family)
MKPRRDENEFNAPEEMVVRITFLLCLIAFTAGVILTLVGAVAHEFRLVAAGVISLVLAATTRSWLKRNGAFEEVEQVVDRAARSEVSPHDARIAELVRLLQLWEQLENKRGSPAFDPWAVQAVRHDIREMVEADPALERLFRSSRRATL